MAPYYQGSFQAIQHRSQRLRAQPAQPDLPPPPDGLCQRSVESGVVRTSLQSASRAGAIESRLWVEQ